MTKLKPYSGEGGVSIAAEDITYRVRSCREPAQRVMRPRGARWGWRRRGAVTEYTSDGVGGGNRRVVEK